MLMRGRFRDQGGLFSYVSPESRVPSGHPLRKIRGLVRDVLLEMQRSFARLYAKDGRPSVPPEQLLSALLIQALYGIRSERQLMEQLDYNLLYRWFVGLSPDDPVWDATTFYAVQLARCADVQTIVTASTDDHSLGRSLCANTVNDHRLTCFELGVIEQRLPCRHGNDRDRGSFSMR
jgi:hypothetical protein